MRGLYSRRINVQHRLVYAVEVGIPKGFQVGLKADRGRSN